MSKTYAVTAEREGSWWLIRIPELDRVTQARRLDQVHDMARDLVAVWLQVPEDSFALTVTVDLDPAIRRHVEAVQAKAASAARASQEAAADTRALVADLAAKGYTVRDIGAILGVSPQRVSQLTTKAAKAAPPATPSKVTRFRPKSEAAKVIAATPIKSARSARTATPPARVAAKVAANPVGRQRPAAAAKQVPRVAAKKAAPVRSDKVITRFKGSTK